GPAVDKDLDVRKGAPDEIGAGIKIIEEIAFDLIGDEKIDRLIRIVALGNALELAFALEGIVIKIPVVHQLRPIIDHPEDEPPLDEQGGQMFEFLLGKTQGQDVIQMDVHGVDDDDEISGEGEKNQIPHGDQGKSEKRQPEYQRAHIK